MAANHTLLDMLMYVYVLATLDTKGAEAEFICLRLQELGVATKLVDTGCLGAPNAKADVPREAVFEAAGTTLAAMRQQGDRATAIAKASFGASTLLLEAFSRETSVAGVLGLGGSAGTTIGCDVMRWLPLGVPKLMVSTLASGQTRPYVGDSDIFMLNSVVDIAGINRISRQILNEAAAAMAGLVKFRAAEAPDDKPLIAATMFGVTTPCVQHARKILEDAGYEVLVFHATGNGGQAMEKLIREGLIAGVLDITTTELADELVGGVLSAGPTRLTAAAKLGVPQVVSVGALDMVNFGPMSTVPDKFRDRKFHRHNDNVTLMRTTAEENRRLGEEIGTKVSVPNSNTVVLLPKRGVSAIDASGQSFDDPAARAELFNGIRTELAELQSSPKAASVSPSHVEVIELDNHINDPAFAEAAAHNLLRLISNPKPKISNRQSATSN
jgi:uncharacterized protein (UPF0261 family)